MFGNKIRAQFFNPKNGVFTFVWIQKMVGLGSHLFVWQLFSVFLLKKVHCLNYTQMLKLENNKKMFSPELFNWPVAILQLTQQCTVLFLFIFFLSFQQLLSLSNGNIFSLSLVSFLSQCFLSLMHHSLSWAQASWQCELLRHICLVQDPSKQI